MQQKTNETQRTESSEGGTESIRFTIRHLRFCFIYSRNRFTVNFLLHTIPFEMRLNDILAPYRIAYSNPMPVNLISNGL